MIRVVYVCILLMTITICPVEQGLCQTPLNQTKPTNKPVTIQWPLMPLKPIRALPQTEWWKHWEWTSEKWHSDDSAYEKTASAIDTAIQKSSKPELLLSHYALLAKKQSSSPIAQFRWGYVAYQLATLSNVSISDGEAKLVGIREALASVSSPHSYNYDRLRFLMEAHQFPFLQLIHAGERLLEKNHNDYEVNYYLISCLSFSNRNEDQQLALAYAQKLIQQKPSKASLYGLLGSVYYRLSFLNHDQSYRDKAITAYQAYLQKSPPNFAFRKNAEDIIRRLQQNSEKQ